MMRREKTMMFQRRAARPSKASGGKRRKGEQGFTLIETTISLVIMMIVGLGAASLFFYAVNYNVSASDRQLAMGVAQKRMEWLRDIQFNATTRSLAYTEGGLASTGADGVTETFTNGDRRYTVVTTITDLQNDPAGNPILKKITLKVTPLGANNTLGSVVLTSIRATVLRGTNS
jgi:type II secretory pathway pseudopilin PulG